jgi:hypothetical protein
VRKKNSKTPVVKHTASIFNSVPLLYAQIAYMLVLHSIYVIDQLAVVLGG